MHGAALVALMALSLAASSADWRDVFVDGQVYFVDADCYSRMTRVEQFMEHPFRRIAHHDFENFPTGTNPHTTMPMDALIAGLAWLITPFSAQARDLAGAWTSPLLGALTVLMLGIWAWRRRLPSGGAMLILVAVSPMLAQAFKLGRPDHQSLTLFLIAAGLAAEFSLWERATLRRAVVWGLAWGAAFWVTLYEPVILFAALLLVRPAILRRAAFTRAWGIGWLVFAAVWGIGVLVDGWRVGPQDPVVIEFFPRWAPLLGELRHLPPFSPELFGWVGWLLPILPALLLTRATKSREPIAIGWLVLVALTYGLTIWQVRWGYFFALTVAMAMPWALAAIPWRAAAWTAFGISLLPIAQDWDGLLFPDKAALAAKQEQTADAVLLREAANSMISSEVTPILAPWWLCPPLAYWSGQPCVGGSSHQSLPGIVDTSRFYLATDVAEAREIVAARRVKFLVAYEPDRVLPTSASILGTGVPNGALGASLYAGKAPPDWRMVYANAYFKIYEVR